ncbi:MAG: twin-arginine translocation pathway signal protein [Rubrivivax sp.]|nr:MAG: twin-arginine translocation pathway signal protein [Rubrivivax sp.]
MTGATTRRQCLATLAAVGLGPALAAPESLLRLLCSGPAGSIPDLVARALAEALAPTLGARVIVDNRPGAAGQLSVGALKAAPADGSTLLVAQGAIATVYPSLYAKLAYDPGADLRPVSLACEMSLALAVGPAVPTTVTTLTGFIGWLRAHPGAANIGSPGIGTLPHLLAARLMGEAGVAWQHVAYAGGPPAVNELLGGQIAALVLPEGLLRQQHSAGRLRVLATSGAARSAYLPEVPTLAEQGHPALVVKEWFAVFARGGTPEGAITGLSAACEAALARAELGGVFSQAGMVPVASSPGELAARIAAEQRAWKPVLKAYGIQAE